MTELKPGTWVRYKSQYYKSVREGHIGLITDKQRHLDNGNDYGVIFPCRPGGVLTWGCDSRNLTPLDEREAAIAEAFLAMGLTPELNQSQQENDNG